MFTYSLQVHSANLELRNISSIRHILSLSTDATKTLVSILPLFVHALTTAILFVWLPSVSLKQITKSSQTTLLALSCKFPQTDYFSLHLASLRSLQHKLPSLCYNRLSSTAPGYLAELLKVYKPTPQLRSSDTSILCLPSVSTHKLGQRAFSYVAPSLCGTVSLAKYVIKH